MLQAGRALQAEDVTAMGDEALVEHLGRVADHMVHGFNVHFDLMLVHNIPLGRLVAACRRWGISDADALGLLAGSSPASVGSIERAAPHRRGVPRRRRRSEDDRRCPRRQHRGRRRRSTDYLADHAWRARHRLHAARALTLIELPDLLVQAIRGAAVAAPRREPDVGPCRAQVPEAERDRFDDLLDDARRCYGIRDDNVGITVMWPVGLVRRAILEVGRRLVEPRRPRRGRGRRWPSASGSWPRGCAVNRRSRDLAKERIALGVAYEADGAPLRAR